MEDFPTQKITIYHKNEKNEYKRYVKEASIRNTNMLNQKNYGFSSSNQVTIRIFDVKGYNKSIHFKNTSSTLNLPLNSFIGDTWKIQKGDIIVNGKVNDDIETTHPLNELSDKYGKDNVFKINSQIDYHSTPYGDRYLNTTSILISL